MLGDGSTAILLRSVDSFSGPAFDPAPLKWPDLRHQGGL